MESIFSRRIDTVESNLENLKDTNESMYKTLYVLWQIDSLVLMCTPEDDYYNTLDLILAMFEYAFSILEENIDISDEDLLTKLESVPHYSRLINFKL